MYATVWQFKKIKFITGWRMTTTLETYNHI